MKNVWVNRNKLGRICHLTYGNGYADIHLPAVYHVNKAIDVGSHLCVASFFGFESDNKIVWFDEDLFIMDGVHYSRHKSFFSVRERRLGVFFDLKEIKDDSRVEGV